MEEGKRDASSQISLFETEVIDFGMRERDAISISDQFCPDATSFPRQQTHLLAYRVV